MTSCKGKPQGKLNVDKVIKGIIQGKKKKDIATDAGSLAVHDTSKINAVNNVMKSDEYKEKTKVLIDKLNKETIRLMENIETSDINGDYKDKAKALETLTKLKELLSGGVTERNDIRIEDLNTFLNNA